MVKGNIDFVIKCSECSEEMYIDDIEFDGMVIIWVSPDCTCSKELNE